MTSTQQRAQLQSQIWKIANDVRGSVDGWDFKQYVLGTLFYRFISENFSLYIEGGDDSVDYASLPDSVITDEIKDDAIKTKGYFIYPSGLFKNVVKDANTNENLNTDLAKIFTDIEASANGYPSEPDIKGLFADFDTTSNRLGNTVTDKNTRLAAVLKGVAGLEFGEFEQNKIDLFGDAYEFLISNYAANAGKSGGEFFTPQSVSKLIAQLAMLGQEKVNKIYDPACGSGSLLLQAKKHFDKHIIEDGFWGQEINHTTYNLARMNMFLHNVNYDKFNITLGNTLTEPEFIDDKPFDAIVSNPPYSVKWIGSEDPTLINDERFAPAGVLAPKSKADFAFVLHSLSYLSAKGRAAIVCFPGIFYRGGAEQKIRKYLVDNNYVESIISLAPNLFYGTTIAVNILVLSKHKTDNKTQFIDASKLFKTQTNTNELTPAHINEIINSFDTKEDIEYFSKSIDNNEIAKKDYNLSVNSYVKAKDTYEAIDISKLSAELKTIVENVNNLRSQIDSIIFKHKGMNDVNFMKNLLNGCEVQWKKLGEVTVIKRGRRVTKSELSPEKKYPVYSGGVTPMGYYEKFNQNENTITIVKYGTAGFVNFIKEKFWANDVCYCINPNETLLNNKYLFYYLKSKQEYIQSLATDAIPAHLPTDNISFLLVPIPSPKVQSEIVKILDNFTELTAELTAELRSRKNQYSYYRDQLFNFPKPKVEE